MIKIKINTKKVIEVNKQNDDIRHGVGEPDAAGDQRYEYVGMEEGVTLEDGTPVCEACLMELLQNSDVLEEAEYRGRKVTLNKPMRGDVKKYAVYVKDPKTGNVKKVNFGDKNMEIKRDNPERRKSFRARHNCQNPGPKTKSKYWSCRMWSKTPVSKILKK